MMRKVCPKCKKCDEVTRTSFPAEHYERMTLSPFKESGKYILGECDFDVEEDWSEYSDLSPDPIYNCSRCNHEYDADTYEKCWEQMVWRKK